MKRILCAVRATLFLILSAAPVSAQFETASIVGTVRDNSGAVIGEATVTLTNVATGVSQTKISDASGIFEFSTLRIGTYLVTAEKAGFAVAVADGIELTVGARQRVDLTMQVGQLTERVEVLAAATRLETDTSQRGQVITGEQTRALPLNGRDYSALALLTTGCGSRRLAPAGLRRARARSTSTACAVRSTTSSSTASTTTPTARCRRRRITGPVLSKIRTEISRRRRTSLIWTRTLVSPRITSRTTTPRASCCSCRSAVAGVS